MQRVPNLVQKRHRLNGLAKAHFVSQQSTRNRRVEKVGEHEHYPGGLVVPDLPSVLVELAAKVCLETVSVRYA